MFAYRKLKVYQKALQWVLDVYVLCRNFPDYEKFALASQVRRAAVSVTSNIAEGMSRTSSKEIVHFLEISYGSLMEVQSQLEVALLLNYVTKDDLNSIDLKTEEIAKMLSGLKLSKLQ
ncbi:MAG: four helix bundle protein [Fibrobacter sp.]|nr:four helix bundle protein [Fibrobacter sp.]MCQ2108909.1 four helix bundle protein [Fibrobacter sp.]MCQ2123616.1 four helix bundle protein [Fibrobacter sp.]